MGKDNDGDDIQLVGIQRGIFDTNPTDYLMLIPTIDRQPEDIMELKADGLWYVRENAKQYEAGIEPSIIILKERGEPAVVSAVMADYTGNILSKDQYTIISADIEPYGEDKGGESGEGTAQGDEGDTTAGVDSVRGLEINEANRTITVTPGLSGLAVLNVKMKLISGDAESQATEYEVPADVAVESEGYALSFSEDTVWTVPKQPSVVTVTLTDANGEVVDPSEYKLLLESDAQGDDDTKVEISGTQITVTQTDDWEEDVVIYAMESGSEASGAETRSAAVSQDTDGPLKLYKVATLRIRPESERPSASSGGSGGGCNAFGGTAALFAAGALFLALRLKKK